MRTMFVKSNERREVKNKYIIRSRISEAKFREILKYFTEDIEASKISNLTKISKVSLCRIFREIRILMAKECEVLKVTSVAKLKISKFSGEISSPHTRPENFAL